MTDIALRKLKLGLRRLEEKGWCKGRAVKREGRKIVGYCALGAIDFNGLASRELQSVINTGVIEWNDRKGQRRTAVIAAFKKAIARRQASLAAGGDSW